MRITTGKSRLSRISRVRAELSPSLPLVLLIAMVATTTKGVLRADEPPAGTQALPGLAPQ